MKEQLVIAIDGPAGSGKSTISKRVAKRLGLLYIDTGAMYRALTVKAMRLGVDLKDQEALDELAAATSIELIESDSTRVLLDNVDVTEAIRTPEVTSSIKFIAKVPGVRAHMVMAQRAMGKRSGAVMEGRDIGTVVFPDADHKFYLDADVAERARRRHKELIASGNTVAFDEVLSDVVTRDESDFKREVGPLHKASDATVIDTTNLSIDEVVESIIKIVRVGR